MPRPQAIGYPQMWREISKQAFYLLEPSHPSHVFLLCGPLWSLVWIPGMLHCQGTLGTSLCKSEACVGIFWVFRILRKFSQSIWIQAGRIRRGTRIGESPLSPSKIYLFVNFVYVSTLLLSSGTPEEGVRSHYRWLWATMWLLWTWDLWKSSQCS